MTSHDDKQRLQHEQLQGSIVNLSMHACQWVASCLAAGMAKLRSDFASNGGCSIIGAGRTSGTGTASVVGSLVFFIALVTLARGDLLDAAWQKVQLVLHLASRILVYKVCTNTFNACTVVSVPCFNTCAFAWIGV